VALGRTITTWRPRQQVNSIRCKRDSRGSDPGRCYAPRLSDSEHRILSRVNLPWLLIITVCSAVFLASAGLCSAEAESPWWKMAWGMDCPAALQTVGAAELPRLWEQGGWWRVVTTGFVHGSALHITLNMWSLWSLGPWASRAWGPARALVCFGASSVGGVLASVAWAEAPVVVGASAGIFGLAGGLWISRGWGDDACRGRVELISTKALGTTLAVMLTLGFFVPMIAQAGHLGGLAMGLALGASFGGVGRSRVAYVAGLAAALALAVGFGLAARAPTWRANYHAFRGFFLLEQGASSSAVVALREALQLDGESADLLNGVAYALAEAGVELEEAERLVDAALSGDAENGDYLDTKGWILCKRGELETGLAWIEKASSASGGAVPEIEEHLRTCESAAPVK